MAKRHANRRPATMTAAATTPAPEDAAARTTEPLMEAPPSGTIGPAPASLGPCMVRRGEVAQGRRRHVADLIAGAVGE
jgi:hypothetical protein